MMISRSLDIALLAGNPAFCAILRSSLAGDRGHRVAGFQGVEAFADYLRMAPLDVVILDGDLPGAPILDIARGLRRHVGVGKPDLCVLALVRAGTSSHADLLAAGVDCVLTKPVHPAVLLHAIEARFEGGEHEVPWGARPGNIVPLFGEGREPH